MRGKKLTPDRIITAIGFTIALIGSAWSIGSIRIGLIPLGIIGAIWYAILLLCLFVPRLSIVSRLGALLSLGIHAVLLLALMNFRFVCMPCFLTTLGAFLAAGAVMASRKASARLALLVVPAGLILGMLGLIAEIRQVFHAVQSLEDQIRGQGNPPAGHVRVVVFGDDEDFLNNRIPVLQKQYTLDVQSLPPARGLPAPTILLMGEGGRISPILGDPPEDAFEKAIEFVRKKPGS